MFVNTRKDGVTREVPPGGCERDGWRENYLRLMPGLSLEDRQVMEYTYMPTGIKREMVRSCVDCHWKGQVVGTIGRGPVPIHFDIFFIINL